MESIAKDPARHAVLLAFIAAVALYAQGETTCASPDTTRILLDRNGTVLKPSPGCRVWTGRDAPTVASCDAFRPSAGPMSIWVEDANSISPRRVDVVVDAACENELHVPVVPAGTVSVMSDVSAERPSLQLVHIAQLEEGLSRAVETPSHVLMPSGPAIGIAFDRQQRAVAVSRPFVVRSERAAELQWPTASVPAVVLTFDITPEAAGKPFQLLANDQVRPDVLLTHRGRHIAIWYGVDAPNARITVESLRVHMQTVEVATDRRGVASAHGSIRPLPSLTVNVAVPDEVRSALDDATISVLDAAGNAPLARSDEVRDSQRFALLPPKIVKIVLDMGAHEVARVADLTGGDDATIDFELEPYVVSGMVSHGGARAKARIEFRRDDSIHTRSDAGGQYEVVLWEGGKYVAEVKLEDEPGVPSHLDLVDVDRSTTTLDFQIPRAEHRVRVVDDRSGDPIAGALITLFNSWNDPRQGERKIGRNVATGSQGEVMLPGLRPGTAVVHVSAEGYFGAEPVHLIAGPGHPPRTIEVRLRAREAGRKALVLLPDGTPAAGARLSAVSAGSPLWTGTADENGSLQMPSTLPADVLMGSHPNAGLFVTRWRNGEHPLTLRLPAPAAPVVVKALRSDGTAARFAPVTIWLDGFAIGGPALTFFSGSAAVTDASGMWIGRSLPAASLRIAIQSRSGADAGALESLATQVPFPWPGVVSVRTIE